MGGSLDECPLLGEDQSATCTSVPTVNTTIQRIGHPWSKLDNVSEQSEKTRTFRAQAGLAVDMGARPRLSFTSLNRRLRASLNLSDLSVRSWGQSRHRVPFNRQLFPIPF